MIEKVLEVESVHAGYGAGNVLRGVTFALHGGECISLMGRNGMGKSTLLKTIIGLVRPSFGSLRALGREIGGMATHRIAASGISYVPEQRGIFPNLSVAEHLRVAARAGLNGQQQWTMDRIYALFPRLAERQGSAGVVLSGGEQQMLTIGRALMTNPAILLLDEATEGLAPLVRDEIWGVIDRIKASGIACVIVDKNIENLVDRLDRHLILVKGEVVFDGDSAALLANPDCLRRHLGV